jgi:hypothetical protein
VGFVEDQMIFFVQKKQSKLLGIILGHDSMTICHDSLAVVEQGAVGYVIKQNAPDTFAYQYQPGFQTWRATRVQGVMNQTMQGSMMLQDVFGHGFDVPTGVKPKKQQLDQFIVRDRFWVQDKAIF